MCGWPPPWIDPCISNVPSDETSSVSTGAKLSRSGLPIVPTIGNCASPSWTLPWKLEPVWPETSSRSGSATPASLSEPPSALLPI